MGESLCRFAYLKVHSAELGNVSIGAQIFSHIFEGLLKMVETTFFLGGGAIPLLDALGPLVPAPALDRHIFRRGLELNAAKGCLIFLLLTTSYRGGG